MKVSLTVKKELWEHTWKMCYMDMDRADGFILQYCECMCARVYVRQWKSTRCLNVFVLWLCQLNVFFPLLFLSTSPSCVPPLLCWILITASIHCPFWLKIIIIIIIMREIKRKHWKDKTAGESLTRKIKRKKQRKATRKKRKSRKTVGQRAIQRRWGPEREKDCVGVLVWRERARGMEWEKEAMREEGFNPAWIMV